MISEFTGINIFLFRINTSIHITGYRVTERLHISVNVFLMQIKAKGGFETSV